MLASGLLEEALQKKIPLTTEKTSLIGGKESGKHRSNSLQRAPFLITSLTSQEIRQNSMNGPRNLSQLISIPCRAIR